MQLDLSYLGKEKSHGSGCHNSREYEVNSSDHQSDTFSLDMRLSPLFAFRTFFTGLSFCRESIKSTINLLKYK